MIYIDDDYSLTNDDDDDDSMVWNCPNNLWLLSVKKISEYV